jgi:hypothetical protein
VEAFLKHLESSGFSQWVLTASGVYPLLLASHAIGLALLMGVVLVINARVLGFVIELRRDALVRLVPWMWAGFGVSVASGLPLFIADASEDFHSNYFRMKIASITVGVYVATYLHRHYLQSNPADQEPSPAARTLAWASLAFWTGAVICGRLVAYFNPPPS